MKRIPHINSRDPAATVGAALDSSQGFRAGQSHRRRSLEVAVGLSSICDLMLATMLPMDKKKTCNETSASSKSGRVPLEKECEWIFCTVPPETQSELIPAGRKIEFESCK